MQEIITEILGRHGFPTKNVEKLVASLNKKSLDDILGATVVANDEHIIGYFRAYQFTSLNEPVLCHLKEWRYCSLGSELVALLKEGE